MKGKDSRNSNIEPTNNQSPTRTEKRGCQEKLRNKRVLSYDTSLADEQARGHRQEVELTKSPEDMYDVCNILG